MPDKKLLSIIETLETQVELPQPPGEGLSCPECGSNELHTVVQVEANTNVVKAASSFDNQYDFYCMSCGYEGDDANGDIDPLMLLGGICRMLASLLPQEVDETYIIVHGLYNKACNAYLELEALKGE